MTIKKYNSVNTTWNTEQTAQFLGVSVNILHKWRREGCGPEYEMIGGRCYYYQVSVQKFKENMPEIPCDVRPKDSFSVQEICKKFGGISSSLLTSLRKEGKGPKSIKIGKRFYYLKSDLNQYLSQNGIKSGIDETDFYTVKKAANEFGIKESSLRGLINKGIEHLKLGERILFPKEGLLKNLEEFRNKERSHRVDTVCSEEEAIKIFTELGIKDYSDFATCYNGIKDCLVDGIRYYPKATLEDFLLQKGIYTEEKVVETLGVDIDTLRNKVSHKVILGVRYYNLDEINRFKAKKK
ncbi:helix-turn-helix domain-containing protein [Helicobacter suis]|uniref:helix-turn-helix domain-containing protein n=1 Tax=Helicobacter suis TaxID=104628 RepID=UPI0013D7EA59|nr:helix-turn-helix domain-containing protein [Helicobacter suis]